MQNKYQFRNTKLKKKKKKQNIKPNIIEKTNSDGYTNLMAAKWNEKKIKIIEKMHIQYIRIIIKFGKKIGHQRISKRRQIYR